MYYFILQREKGGKMRRKTIKAIAFAMSFMMIMGSTLVYADEAGASDELSVDSDDPPSDAPASSA